MGKLRVSLVGLVLSCSLIAAGCGDDAPPPAPPGTDGSVGGDGGRDSGMDAGGGSDTGASCSSDTECEDGTFCNGAETCDPSDPMADADGCVTDPDGPCLAGQTCDEAMRMCITECAVTMDADGDGVDAMACGGMDCDDSDRDTYPGNLEVCDIDGHDEDCNTATFGDRDLDGDGATDWTCCNGATCGTDCDDLDSSTNPTTSEVCDGYDNNCDSVVDEGVFVLTWPDADGDHFGDDSGTSMMACADAPGRASTMGDCDDSRPDRNRGQVEVCDVVDNDCDTRIDESPAVATWYPDADMDGYGDASAPGRTASCTIPGPNYSIVSTDCDDTNRDISPREREQCNGIDDNCDGRANYFLGPSDSEDDDGDAHADIRCVDALGRPGDDCDDNDPTTYPTALEICDRRDNDCNALVDDGSAMGMWFVDADHDTYGTGTAVLSCSPVTGRITRAGDCEDTDPARHPSAPEPCDGVDNDCDTSIDEGSPELRVYYVDSDLDGVGVDVTATNRLACTMPSGYAQVAGDCQPTNPAVTIPSWYTDADMDAYGAGAAIPACMAPSGRVADNTDCNDAMTAIHPGATELCNGTDDDCDMTVDDGAAATCMLANATATCGGGMCTIASCSSGYTDCNTMPSDGCESNTATDRLNCGACGRTCAAGTACRAGRCEGVVQLEGGIALMCAIVADAATFATTGGRVVCWGACGLGQCGSGSVATQVLTPTQVQLYTTLPLNDAIDIGVGDSHACAVRVGGTVVCWGSNSNGQLGTGSPGGGAARAQPVAGLTAAVRVAGGPLHTCAVESDGSAWCWGENSPSGNLSDGTTTARPSPTRVLTAAATPMTDAIDVSCGGVAGGYFSCFGRSGSATASCAGYNGNGQLGIGTAGGTRMYATNVSGLPAGALQELRSGARHTCVRISGQRPYCWGYGGEGQIDRSSTSDAPGAVPVDPVIEMPHSLAGNQRHSCVAYTHPVFGNRVSCFGYDSSGTMGDGTATPAPDPVPDDVVTSTSPLTYLTGVRVVGAGQDFTCAALDTGSVVCWGYNLNGALGRGAVTPPYAVLADVPVVGLP